jgi:hypothetical protein
MYIASHRAITKKKNNKTKSRDNKPMVEIVGF